MPPAKFQMSEELRAEIKAKGNFFDISKYFVDKCYEINGIEETHQAYAERLRQAREEKSYLQKGYSQKDLAKAIGCSVECISRIERKKNKDIDVERLQVLAYILNVTPHYLIGAVDKKDHSAFFNEERNKICELQKAVDFYTDKDLKIAREYVAKDRLKQVAEMQK